MRQAISTFLNAFAGDAARAGFVACRVGAGETFDFSPPPNATVVAEWERHRPPTSSIRPGTACA